MSTDIISWALPRIGRLLPLDDGSLKDVINYSTSLSKEAGAAHLQNILGDSSQALDFISSFNARRTEFDQVKTSSADQGVSRQARQTPKRYKPPLHSTGQVRRPEGYGDVTGGYHKSTVDTDYAPSTSRKAPSATALSNALSLSQQPEALQLPRVTLNVRQESKPSSRDASPRPNKLPPSAAGSLISDMPNVKAKQAKKSSQGSGTSSPHYKTVTTTASSINDLTRAIAALELSTNPSLSTERRKCPCNASIHPLFTTAPNCLNCGKIICVLEGLQPCSFCDSPILTKEQVSSMIRALKEERGQERMVAHNTGAASSGRGTPAFGGTTPDSGNSGDESSAASRARAHRDKLLGFQKNNTQRTRVHDEAADYDVTLTPGTTQWMSPVQRAAALKKQQQYMREMEEAARPEYEKRKTIMSMSIKNGKLVKTIQKVNAPSAPPEEQEEVVEEETSHQPGGESSRTSGGGAFGNNPLLLSGKLIRPVWRAPDDGKGKGKAEDKVERKSVWRRRVQDDNEDNEQWILDGGANGFGDRSKEEGD
jgi:hypothetical protein